MSRHSVGAAAHIQGKMCGVVIVIISRITVGSMLMKLKQCMRETWF